MFVGKYINFEITDSNFILFICIDSKSKQQKRKFECKRHVKNVRLQ